MINDHMINSYYATEIIAAKTYSIHIIFTTSTIDLLKYFKRSMTSANKIHYADINIMYIPSNWNLGDISSR